MSRNVCFIHSFTGNYQGTKILDLIINTLVSTGCLEKLSRVYINNIGMDIPVDLYSSISDKIVIFNYSNEPHWFENCTLRQMHFYCSEHPNDKILYIHTKGSSYPDTYKYIGGVKDWVDFMLYCLVNKHTECIEMLDYVQVVGQDYRPDDGINPDHFSGNFWWSQAKYIQTLSMNRLKIKHDAEWWLFSKKPVFINIHKCPYGHYENRYPPEMYSKLVDIKINAYLNYLRYVFDTKAYKSVSIHYGIMDKKNDVTEICRTKLYSDGILNIPKGSSNRDSLFGDPLKGIHKIIMIDTLSFDEWENVKIPCKL